MLLEKAPLFDFDNDGVADSLPALRDAYRAGRIYFTTRLRETFGASCLILANSAGPLADPALNGIALEEVGGRYFTVEEARSHLLGQQEVAAAPFTSILWVISPESAYPSFQLCCEFSGVAYGTLRQLN
jgi:hypothetical protein